MKREETKNQIISRLRSQVNKANKRIDTINKNQGHHTWATRNLTDYLSHNKINAIGKNRQN